MNVRKSLLLACSLLAVIGLRCPFQSEMLYDFDSIGFSSGIEHFDVSRFSPHPPGYPLYVASGKILNQWLKDPNRSMVWLSTVASALSVVAIFLLGTRMFSVGNGVLSALFLTFSPLFWLFGEVAVPYAFGILFSTVVALLLWESRNNTRIILDVASVLLAIGGGYRPDLLIDLGLLWLVSMRGRSTGKIVWCLFLCAGTIAAWLVPTIVLSGGWKQYWEAIQFQKLGVQYMALYINAAKLLAYSAWGLGVLVLFTPLCLRRSFWKRLCEQNRRSFVFIWIAPYVLGTTFIEFGQPGMLLVILPPLILLYAEAVLRYSQRSGSSGIRRLGTSKALVTLIGCGAVVGNSYLFVSAPLLNAKGFLADTSSLKEKINTEFFLLSARGIRFVDRFYKTSFDYITTHFPPDQTIVLTNFAGWVHASYYLRSYEVHNYFLFYGVRDNRVRYVPEGTVDLSSRIKYVVLFNGNKHSMSFNDTLTPYNLSAEHTTRVQLPHGFSLSYLSVPERKNMHFTSQGFSLR